MHVRHQIGTLSKTWADAFLIPDNHLGRATVLSVAVAHEVEAMGGRSIACLNSRIAICWDSAGTCSRQRPMAWISSCSSTGTSQVLAAGLASCQYGR